MKRILNTLLAAILTIAIVFALVPSSAGAVFNDLERRGVKYDLVKGNWTVFYTKLPGSKSYQKLYARITKFRRVDPSESSTGGGGGSSSGDDAVITVTMTVEVALPKALPKGIAKKLAKRTAANSGGDMFIDYVELCIVDKRSGENLNTSVTDGENGDNYKTVTVTESEWKKYKPQRVRWKGGAYNYYVAYAKSLTITFPKKYKNTCVGVCGSHVNSYPKMQEWNKGFQEGYLVFSDTTHVKTGNKKETAKLSHFINIK